MFSFTYDDAVATIADYGDTEPHDIAHELADGSEYVIYPARAWELVTLVGQHEIAQADEAIADCAMLTQDTTLLDHACYVAYWIIYYRVLAQLETAIVEAEIAAEEDAG